MHSAKDRSLTAGPCVTTVCQAGNTNVRLSSTSNMAYRLKHASSNLAARSIVNQ